MQVKEALVLLVQEGVGQGGEPAGFPDYPHRGPKVED